MRDSDRRTWATYVRVARERAGLNRTDFAQAVGIGRATAWRWETSTQRPERAEIVARVARVLGLDLDEALAAAGLRLAASPPEQPERQDPPVDPRLKLIFERLADPTISQDERLLIEALINHLAELAERAGQRTQT